MQDIISKVHAHMPFHLLPEYQEMVLQHKINLEIYFHHGALQSLDKLRCSKTAKILTDAGFENKFSRSFHGFTSGSHG